MDRSNGSVGSALRPFGANRITTVVAAVALIAGASPAGLARAQAVFVRIGERFVTGCDVGSM